METLSPYGLSADIERIGFKLDHSAGIERRWRRGGLLVHAGRASEFRCNGVDIYCELRHEYGKWYKSLTSWHDVERALADYAVYVAAQIEATYNSSFPGASLRDMITRDAEGKATPAPGKDLLSVDDMVGTVELDKPCTEYGEKYEEATDGKGHEGNSQYQADS